MEHSVTSGLARAVRPAQTGPGSGKPSGGAAAGGGFASVLTGLGAEELAPAEVALADERPAASPREEASPEGGADPFQAMAAMIPQLGAVAPQGEAGSAETPASASLPAGGGPWRSGPAAAPDATMGAMDTGEAVAEAAGTDLMTPASGKTARPATVRPAPTGQRAAAPLDERAVQERQQQRLDAAVLRHSGVELVRRELEPALLLTAGLGERDLLPPSRRDEKAGHGPVGGAEMGLWSGLTDGPRLEVPVVAPDPQMMTENQVAEQVSYWVSHGVQNAELELEGLGEGAVQVSIAVQGQEARVEFRADQAQVRQVLEDSMPQLRDLLAREGLVLSGVSVGASGADGSGGRPAPEQRRGERQARVAVPELAVAVTPGAAARAGGLSGRSVDLFV